MLRLSSELDAPLAAATAAVEAGKGPLAVLRAFAAASEGAIDDAAVAELEAAVRSGMHVASVVVAATAAIAVHEPALRAFVERALAGAVDAGYVAGAWNARLAAWMEE